MVKTAKYGVGDWSKVLLNDSTELLKKRSKRSSSGHRRRLFSKLKDLPIPVVKVQSKSNFYKKYMNRSKRSSYRQMTPKVCKERIINQCKKEYDVWNVIVDVFEQNFNLKTIPNKAMWPMNELGIRDSNNDIRLIQNRDELNEQILVSSNGSVRQVKGLINPNDDRENVSLKIKYKFIPIIESLTVVRNSIETSYEFTENAYDINNNMECISQNENDFNDEETLANKSIFQDTADISCDTTIINMSDSAWEYSEFCSSILEDAQSTVIMEEKESIPVVAQKR